MEDMKKLDEEIVRCAEAVHDTLMKIEGARYLHEDATVHALFSAVAAKREASRPKLLSAKEASHVYLVVSGNAGTRTYNSAGLRAVLDADRASILKVAGSLPGVWETADGRKHVPLGELDRALTSARGDQS